MTEYETMLDPNSSGDHAHVYIADHIVPPLSLIGVTQALCGFKPKKASQLQEPGDEPVCKTCQMRVRRG